MACKAKYREAALDLMAWMEATECGQGPVPPAREPPNPRLLALGALVGAGLGTIFTVASAALT